MQKICNGLSPNLHIGNDFVDEALNVSRWSGVFTPQFLSSFPGSSHFFTLSAANISSLQNKTNTRMIT
jgi:hypothetical protein